jgi:hypothetical protein
MGCRAALMSGAWERVKLGGLPSTTSPMQDYSASLASRSSQSTPLELGIVPIRRRSTSVAMRIALAKALKVASIM